MTNVQSWGPAGGVNADPASGAARPNVGVSQRGTLRLHSAAHQVLELGAGSCHQRPFGESFWARSGKLSRHLGTQARPSVPGHGLLYAAPLMPSPGHGAGTLP